MKIILKYFFWILLLIVSCDNKTSSSKASLPAYTLQKPVHAKGFYVEQYKNYKVLFITQPYSDRKDTLRYVLANPEVELPNPLKKLPRIPYPVQRLVTMATTHLALIEALSIEPIVIGAGSLEYVYSPKIKSLAEAGKIKSLHAQNPDLEQIIALRPEVVMVSGGTAASLGSYQKLQSVGIPVIINSEWLEITPLGKAEWVKLMGVLSGKEAEAQKLFDQIEKKYIEVRNLTKNISRKKTVFTGSPYKDTWYMATGESFVGKFLEDAGANYIYKDVKGSVSIPLPFEKVYADCAKAGVWIDADASTLDELLKIDPRLKNFKSFQDKQVYNRNKRISGGNDYWESGVVQPDLILKDMVKILYPELLPGYELYYHKPLL